MVCRYMSSLSLSLSVSFFIAILASIVLFYLVLSAVWRIKSLGGKRNNSTKIMILG